MCGIAGYVTSNEGNDLSRFLRPLADAMRHRGPDDEGYFHVAGLEKLSIVLQRCLHLAHVTKTREFQRFFEMTRLRVGFTDCCKHTTELFGWLHMQIFVANEYAIGSPSELREPFVHRLDDQSNAENRIVQHVSHGAALELIAC